MTRPANNGKIIKQANEYLVLDALRNNRELSVEDIVTVTRLSRQTVLHIIKDLDEKKMIVKCGLGESMGGRQPVLYALDLGSHFAVGIDFEFPPVRLAFSDLNGKIVFSKKWRLGLSYDAGAIVNLLAYAVEEGMEALQITSKNLIGIGLGIPGQLNIHTNSPVSMVRIINCKHEDIAKALSERLSVGVTVRNDVHLLAASECRLHQKCLPNFIYVAHRVGIGMAVFIGGKCYEGNFGNSGYIGHVVMDPTGGECVCGKHGCLETYATQRAIAGEYTRQSGLEQPATYLDVIALARRDDKTAAQIVQNAAEKMALAISSAILLYDIQTVIIGDLDSDDEGFFFEAVKKNIKKLVLLTADEFQLNILQGLQNEDNFALGGCHLVIESFFSAPKLKLKSVRSSNLL